MGVRLLLSFFAIFIASSFLLFASVYIMLLRSLEKKDHELIRAQQNELVLRYEQQGIEGIRDAHSRAGTTEENWVYIRVEGLRGETLFLHKPINKDPFDLSRLDGSAAKQEAARAWIYIDRTIDQDVLEFLSVRLKDGNFLQVGRSSSDRNDQLDELEDIFFGVSLPLIILGFVGSIYLSTVETRPIRNLINTVQSIHRGQLSARVPEVSNRNELSELTRLFNQMLGQIDELVRNLKGTIDHIAHDLRTPLTRLRGVAEAALLAPDGSPTLYREALASCIESSEDALELFHSILDVSEAESGALRLRLELCDPAKIVAEVAELYEMVAEEARIDLQTELACEDKVLLDYHQIKRALANLIDNAIKYNHPGGKLLIRGQLDASTLTYTVRDTGMGISADDLPLIWNRLYRSDPSRTRQGWGLGVTLVKAIIEAHGGSITVESVLGQGSTFTVRLPRAQTTS